MWYIVDNGESSEGGGGGMFSQSSRDFFILLAILSLSPILNSNYAVS